MKNIVLLVLSTFIIQFGYTEGIKQLAPDTTAGVQLRFNYDPDPNSSDGGPFATPVAPPEYRLYVTAAAAGVKLYFGLNHARYSITLLKHPPSINYPNAQSLTTFTE